MDISSYRKNRETRTQKLIESYNKPTYQNQNEDARFWKPTLDEEKGVGGAVIRFLPPKDDSALPYVSYGQYSFKWDETNQWFIERSLQSIGIHDPVYELRTRLYKTQQESDKQLAGKIRASKKFVANIRVISDPAVPENNGKTFLYLYNATIDKMIETALKPTPDPLTGEVADPMDAFDLLDGANLQLRIAKTKNGWSYDKTDWSKPHAITEDDNVFAEIIDSVYELDEFVSADKFKTYDQLNERLAKVMGTGFVGTGVPVLTKPVDVKPEASRTPQTQQTQQTSAPQQKEAKSNDLPFEPDTKAGDVDVDDEFEALMKSM